MDDGLEVSGIATVEIKPWKLFLAPKYLLLILIHMLTIVLIIQVLLVSQAVPLVDTELS